MQMGQSHKCTHAYIHTHTNTHTHTQTHTHTHTHSKDRTHIHNIQSESGRSQGGGVTDRQTQAFYQIKSKSIAADVLAEVLGEVRAQVWTTPSFKRPLTRSSPKTLLQMFWQRRWERCVCAFEQPNIWNVRVLVWTAPSSEMSVCKFVQPHYLKFPCASLYSPIIWNVRVQV